MAKFRISPEQLKAIAAKRSPKNKYGAKSISHDGIRFPSLKEGGYYLKLKKRQMDGEIKSFTMQIPFHLPGKSIHRIDFMIINHDNTVEFIEVKGRDLPLGKLKRQQTEELYNIEIKVV